MKIDRKKLAAALKIASKGLSDTGGCNSFVFHSGKITTFNGEVRVQVKDPAGLSASVPSVELINLINRFSKDEIEIVMSDDNSEVRVKGAGARAGIRCDVAAISTSEIPPVATSDWSRPPETFIADLLSASKVCGTDDSMAVTMCVRILSNRIEACDNYRAMRITKPTGVDREFYLLASNVAILAGLSITKIAVVGSWLHARFDGGMISLRGREFTEYPNLEPLMSIGGSEIIFPKELSEGISRSQVFTSEQTKAGGGGMRYYNRVTVTLTKGLAKIHTGSSRGWYSEDLKLKYDGPDIAFDAHPDSMQQILNHSFLLRYSEGKLVAQHDGTCMVIATRIPND